MATASSDTNDAHAFYNNPLEVGLDRRNESKIVYMRNFNNWIKSTLIDQYLQRLKDEQPERKDRIHVFDMGCGKGGDQLKWSIGRVHFVTFADLTENSVEVCQQRYHDRKRPSGYGAEFFTLDCTKELIRDKRASSKPIYDLVSTQFVIHYAFDKFESANQFLRNASELLRVGGYFIGTTVNACDLVKRCRASPDQSISNDVFKIVFDSSVDLSQTNNNAIPLFGAKYHFTLDELVDCPEYLVYFPLLEKLAERHGLKVIDRQTFRQYFDSNGNTEGGRSLLSKMRALESYTPPRDGQQGPPIDHSQYTHVEQHLHENNEDHHNQCCGTLSQQEWEITSLYIIFAFQKVREVTYDGNTVTDE